MAQHFKVKLMHFGLNFPNDESRIRAQDIKVSEKPVPILLNQQFKGWFQDETTAEIGSANVYTENFDLVADCYFDRDVMVVQPLHDHIIIRTLKGNLLPFNSFSLHIDLMSYEGPESFMIPRILNARVKSLSPVPYGADPAFCEPYIFTDPDEKHRQADQAIIFPGPLINKFILD